MALFDLFKKKTGEKLQTENNVLQVATVHRGNAVAKKIDFDSISVEFIRKQFIAFDVETTGFSPFEDRIIEIAAIEFSNGKVTNVFSSLVNPEIPISPHATAVNHITNSMVSNAPSEKELYPQFIDFLRDALHGNTIMCAHNAKFDFDFLCNTLARLGYDADIRYIDTLSLSRKYIGGLDNYKQSTLEAFYGLTNSSPHRAGSDAENCGNILCYLLDYADKALKEEKLQVEQSSPKGEELDVCAYIQNVIAGRGGDTKWLRYRRSNSNYIYVTCFYTFLKFKISKKGKYILIKKDCPAITNFIVEPSTESEGGTDYIRVLFSNPFDLEPLSQFIYDAYLDSYKSLQYFMSCSDRAKREAEDGLRLMSALSEADVDLLLKNVNCRKYSPVTACVVTAPIIARANISINAEHTRVSINEIKNRDDRYKGYEKGISYWERGEAARKNGRIEEALELFDQARFNGLCESALYKSYALAYRQIKDYDNEIIILEEGISRLSNDTSILETRLDKALKLLNAQQEAVTNTEEKGKARAEKTKKESSAFES